MHELSIAKRIVDIIEEEAVKRGIAKVKCAHLRIGKMAAFQREQLEFCLPSYKKNERLSGMHFEIEEVAVEVKCQSCGMQYLDNRFEDDEFAHETAHAPMFYMPPACPACAGKDVIIVSGKEMELSSIESG